MACLAGATARASSFDSDSLPASSAGLDSLAAKMQRNWVTRSLSRYVIQPESAPLQDQLVKQNDVEFFVPYRGLFIRRITVVQLNVFSDLETGTRGGMEATLERVGQALHAETREGVLRKYFLMQPGDPLDPDALADTERLLRGTSFLREAEIVPQPVDASADSVDLLVVTRDQWSLGLDVQVKSMNSTDLRVADRNFGGWGHLFQNGFLVDTEAQPAVGYVGSYRVDNIRGTFLLNTYDFQHTARETSGHIGLARNRVAPQIRTTGAVDVTARDLTVRNALEPPQSYFDAHLWMGRAFPVGPAPPGGISRSAVVVAGGAEGINFWKRPDSVTVEFNRGFHDRLRLLSSVSFARSDFQKERLLHGFGFTEDVPTGVLATLTMGGELCEFSNRGYGSGLLRAGAHTGLGYFDGSAAAGAFLNQRSWEDGVVDLSTRWISDLWVAGGYGLRQFVDAHYTYGFAWRGDEEVLLGGESAMDHMRGLTLAGRERLVGNLESVLFTPWHALGYRFALFGRWSAGTTGPAAESFLHGAYFSTLGIGLRVHNSRLIFAPVELRFSFALRQPEGTSIDAVDFGNMDIPRFQSYEPGPPAVLDYR